MPPPGGPYFCRMFQLLRPWAVGFLVVGLLGGGTGQAVAQRAAPAPIRLLPEDAERGNSGHQHNFYFLPPGATGEKYVNAGFFGNGLRPYVAANAEARQYLNRYRRQKTIFLLDRVVTAGALVYYGVKVFEEDKFPQYASSEQKVAAGLFVGGLLATIFINRNTNLHFQRAVNAYNTTGGTGNRWRRLRPETLGLGVAAGGPALVLGWAVR